MEDSRSGTHFRRVGEDFWGSVQAEMRRMRNPYVKAHLGKRSWDETLRQEELAGQGELSRGGQSMGRERRTEK